MASVRSLLPRRASSCLWIAAAFALALGAAQNAQAQPLSSGVKLGITITVDPHQPRGLRVQTVDPDGPSAGFLRPGDKITKMTDLSNGNTYITQSISQIEFAKSQIGTNWAEIDVRRGGQKIPLYVQLVPVGGGVAGAPAPPTFSTEAPEMP